MLTALAGARRAETAYDRFLDDTDAWDVAGTVTCDPTAPPDGVETGDFVGQQGQVVAGTARRPGSLSPEACLERFRALPSVVDLTTVNQYGAQFAPVHGRSVQPTGDSCYSGPGVVTVAGDPTGRFGTEINRFKIVEGRAAEPTAADEVIVSRDAARRLGLRPGDALEAAMVSYEHCLDGPAGWPEPTRFTVVGIGVGSLEVRPSSGFFINFVTTTPAFVDTIGTDAMDGAFTLVRLRSGNVPAFLAEAETAGMRMEAQLVQADYHADLQRGIRPSAQGLQILAALAGLAGVAVVGQLLIRQTALEATDHHVLRALGSSRRARFAVAAAWSVPVAVVATLTALVVAGAGSWWMPIGVAGVVEPDTGLSIDVPLFVVGAAVVALAVLLAAALPAARLAASGSPGAEAAGSPRPSRAVAALARASFPPTAITGVRMALETGRGRSAVPVRSSLLAIIAGVLALAGTVTFGASLARLLDTPRLVGWNWDSRVGYPRDAGTGEEEGEPLPRTKVVDALAAHPDVAAFGLSTIFPPFPGRSLELGDDHIPVGSMSFDTGSGNIGPSLTEGRAPSAPDELLLGPATADLLGLDVGDRVTAYGQTGEWGQPETYEDTAMEMEIVGFGILPLGGGDRLGTGATMTTDGLRVLSGSGEPDSVLLRFAPGADPARVIGELSARLGLPEPDPADLAEELALADGLPTLDVRQVNQLPLLLGVLMSLMSMAVLAHVLVSAVGARRNELALLRAIGFDRGQVRRTVAWQAATIALAALAIALPLGIVLGRRVWLVFADRIGVVPEAVVPLSFALVVPAILVAALLIAAVPARLATRPRPAVVLRSE